MKIQSDINDLKASLEQTKKGAGRKVAKAETKIETYQQLINELWDYKVDPKGLQVCWNLEKEKQLVQKINHKKNNFNIDGTNEKENKTWNQ